MLAMTMARSSSKRRKIPSSTKVLDLMYIFHFPQETLRIRLFCCTVSGISGGVHDRRACNIVSWTHYHQRSYWLSPLPKCRLQHFCCTATNQESSYIISSNHVVISTAVRLMCVDLQPPNCFRLDFTSACRAEPFLIFAVVTYGRTAEVVGSIIHEFTFLKGL